MEQNIFYKRNDSGQVLVEYIFLIAIMASLAISIFKSERFKRVFSNNSSFFQSIQNGMSYSYRYGREWKSDNANVDFEYVGKNHDTYYNSEKNVSRFFSGRTPYP